MAVDTNDESQARVWSGKRHTREWHMDGWGNSDGVGVWQIQHGNSHRQHRRQVRGLIRTDGPLGGEIDWGIADKAALAVQSKLQVRLAVSLTRYKLV